MDNSSEEDSKRLDVENQLTTSQKIGKWINKYCFEGQHLDNEAAIRLQGLSENPTLYELLFVKYRKYTAALVPCIIVEVIWWILALYYNLFQYYPEYWHMPVTMIIGAFLGGMTSEGSGAVIFPVMTIVLHMLPSVARDFSLMIQSIGMASAMACVIFMKIRVERNAVLYGLSGAMPGFIIGVHYLDPLFTGGEKKMMFVSIWTAFAIALAILNAQKKRSIYFEIPDFDWWKAIVLVGTGLVGGFFDSFSGSGCDVTIFAMITLLFRVSEKTATATTIVIKGFFALFGFFYRSIVMGDVDPLAYRLFTLTTPIVAFTGPLGSLVGSHLHRQFIAGLFYVLQLGSIIGFLCTLPPWHLIVIGIAIIATGYVLFSLLSHAGLKLIARIESEKKEGQMDIPL